MRIHALIPVKDLARTKSRLTPPFTEDERAALTLDMLRHVIVAAHESGVLARMTVISPDPAVLALAQEKGASALPQRTTGLNPALDEGRADAIARGAEAVLILPADLPQLQPGEIVGLIAALPPPPAVVIAPDYTGHGTNALLVAPPDALPFLFGVGSFALHVAAADARGVSYAIVRAPGIAGDVDTPDDVRERVGSAKMGMNHRGTECTEEIRGEH